MAGLVALPDLDLGAGHRAAVQVAHVALPPAVLAQQLHLSGLRALPILAGILVATLVNHALAGAVGAWVATALGPDILRWVIGLSFLAMAGMMVWSGRLPGPMQLGCAGSATKQAPRFCSAMPVFGVTTQEPKPS